MKSIATQPTYPDGHPHQTREISDFFIFWKYGGQAAPTANAGQGPIVHCRSSAAAMAATVEGSQRITAFPAVHTRVAESCAACFL